MKVLPANERRQTGKVWKQCSMRYTELRKIAQQSVCVLHIELNLLYP